MRDGPEAVRDLIRFGTRFTRVEEGGEDEYDLGREGGHSHRRVLHAQDLTGRRSCVRWPRPRARAEISARSKIKSRSICWSNGVGRGGTPRIMLGGVCVRQDQRRGRKILARATLLATGGAGKVYLYTTNPDIASGDGVAMAYRAGAPVANMEFIQFHPTCLYHPAAKSFLISEALRGEGAILKLPDGTPFMKSYHPDGELAPRDIVARAIDSEMKRHGLDCVLPRHEPSDPPILVRSAFPNIYQPMLELRI